MLILLTCVLVAASAVARAEELTRAPELVHFVEAVVPDDVDAEPGETFTVVLQFVVRTDGEVEEVEVVEPAGEPWDTLARDAGSALRFTPAEVDGSPRAIRIRFAYSFVIPETVIVDVPPSLVSGIVIDAATGNALAGVIVRVHEGAMATTNDEGRFEIGEQAPGPIELELVRDDLGPLYLVESVEAGEQLFLRYEVSLRPPIDGGEDILLEIVVARPRLDVVASSTRVSAAEARAVPGTAGDVVRVVESLPGVARVGAGQGAIVVWGAAPEDTRVYVDGVPLPRLYHETGVRAIVHPAFVRSVALEPGGWGASWGRGIGGLVRVDTSDPEDEGVRASVGADVYDVSGDLAWRGASGVSAGAAGRVGVLRPLAQAIDERTGEFAPLPDFWDAQVRGGLPIGDTGRLTAVWLAAGDQIRRGVPNADPALVTREERALSFGRFYLRYEDVPLATGNRTVVTPWIGWDRERRSASFGAVVTGEERRSTTFGVRASHEVRLHRQAGLEVGLDAEYVHAELSRRGSLSLPPREGDRRVFGQPPPDTRATDTQRASTVSLAPYAEARLAFFEDRVQIVPGVRLDPHVRTAARRTPVSPFVPEVGRTRSDLRVQPRLAAQWSVVEGFELRAATGRYHQFPALSDTSAVFGNPDLGLASAQHHLVGAAATIPGSLRIEVTGFRVDSEGLAVRNPADSPQLARALVPDGAGRARGVQTMVRRDADGGWFGWVAHTWSVAERQDRTNGPWRAFDFDQTHVISAVAGWQPLRDLELSVRARYATGLPRTDVLSASYDATRDRWEPAFGAVNAIRLPDFLQVDVRGAYSLPVSRGRLAFSLELLNITFRENVEEFVFSSDYATRGAITGLPFIPVFGLQWSIDSRQEVP